MMQGLLLKEPRSLRFVDVPDPVADKDDALVRVLACGVCGTDLHAYKGTQPFFSYPRRLGHELCVEVISAPSGSGLQPGERCAVEPYLSCGQCPACRMGKTNCCHSLRVLGVHRDGGHVPEMTLPWRQLHRSETLGPVLLALAEPLVIGAHAVERADPAPGEPVVILGMGPIGLAVALFATAAGADVAVVDPNDARLRFATETMGVGEPLAAGDDLGDRLKAKFGQLPVCVIDATGSSRSMNHSFELAEHGGRIVFVGLFIGDLQFDDPNFHRRELTLLASRAGLSSDFTKVIRAIENGGIDPLPMVTHHFPFGELDRRFPDLFTETDLVKAIIDY